jgi:putative two-component system response regulator
MTKKEPSMYENKRVLVVDDQEGQRALLVDLVTKFGHQAECAADGFEAIAKLKLGFDLVLLDAKMPGMDGFEVLRHIRQKEHDPCVPVLMVTGLDSAEDRRRAVENGADDFVTKPVREIDLQARLTSLLRRKEAEDALVSRRNALERKVERQTAELREAVEELTQKHRQAHRAELETLERLAVAAEYRDKRTGEHVRRIGDYCALLGERLHLEPGEVEVLRHASPLHDVGKIGVPDSILLKPGELTADEWQTMKKHTTYALPILGESSSKYLQAGKEIALTHQERWDGSGYPRGLQGQQIPLRGRICAVADVFDALTADRPYRDALPPEEAVEIMKKGRGTDFDPELLDLFLQNLDALVDVREKEVSAG